MIGSTPGHLINAVRSTYAQCIELIGSTVEYLQCSTALMDRMGYIIPVSYKLHVDFYGL